MHALFVFDEYLIVKKMPSLFGKGDTIYLFPLTSKYSLRDAVIEKLKSTGCDIQTLPSSQLINASASGLRQEYLRFVAEFPGKVQREGRDLKEIFAIDGYVSLWWFSLIAEKNTFKSDSFNRLSQLDSIISVTKRERIEKIIFGCRSGKLKDALGEYLCKNDIKFQDLPTNRVRSLKMRVKGYQKFLYLKHIVILVYIAIRTLLRTRLMKRRIGFLNRSISKKINPLLFLTPYPNIDESLAKEGVFKNRSYVHLQEALEERNRDIVWIAMYENYTAISFKKSLEYAKRFIENGYTIFFLEEFNSFGKQIKAFFGVIKSGFKFLKLKKDIYRAHSFRDYNIYPIFKDDWHSSFIGVTGYRGSIHYYMFKSMLNQIKAEICLYHCEMLEWEKALISARDASGIKIALYGYQSAGVSKMLLNYFNHSREISNSGSYCLPQPDKIICNGRMPYARMKESGWPEEKLLIAEALRYNYIKKTMRQKWNGKKDIVALAFSINVIESSSILNVVCNSLKDVKDIEVWLKPHPALNIEQVLTLSGISAEDFSFQVKNGSLEEVLSEARIVIASQSTTSVEALAYGCDVIIVNIPEWINMALLQDVRSKVVRTVSSSEDLRRAVINIFKEEYKPEIHAAERLRIINDFFHLDQNSDTPKVFLELLASTSGKI